MQGKTCGAILPHEVWILRWSGGKRKMMDYGKAEGGGEIREISGAVQEIERNGYLQQLILRKDNGLIKVITGIRRCGKSFLLFHIFKKYLLKNGVAEDHVIEIALDGIENEELRNPKTCYQYVKAAIKDNESYYLLLDEIQFMPRFEEVLNSLLRISNIDIYVTGSNSRFLSSDIVTEFRGRGDEIRVYPLSFAEFYSVYDGEYEDAWSDYMIF